MNNTPHLRCSSLSRIINCAHSLRLPKEKISSTYAERGTLQHIIASEFLKGKVHKIPSNANKNTRIYIDYVHELQVDLNIECSLHKNFKTFILKGTPDAYQVRDDLITIVDLKNGYEKINPRCDQLLGYAALVFLTNTIKHSDAISIASVIAQTDFIPIKLVIVQNEEIIEAHITQYCITTLLKKIKTSIHQMSYNLGPHCKYCDSKRFCSLMQQELNEIHTMCSRTYPLTSCNDNILHNILKNKNIIKKSLDEFEEWGIFNRPEWFIKKTRKLKKWIDETKAPTVLKTMTPASALREGLNVENNITEKESYSYIIK